MRESQGSGGAGLLQRSPWLLGQKGVCADSKNISKSCLLLLGSLIIKVKISGHEKMESPYSISVHKQSLPVTVF